jgi:hypothetical protein
MLPEMTAALPSCLDPSGLLGREVDLCKQARKQQRSGAGSRTAYRPE